MDKKIKYALVTGATSGIGREMAIYLDMLGYNVIAVARNKERLEKLKNELKNSMIMFQCDLSKIENIDLLYDSIKEYDISIFVNNAGVGVYGKFVDIDLEFEKSMINLNVIAPHILIKKILIDMLAKNEGYILNVASSSAFVQSGPFMSSYYATKSYIYLLSNSIAEELDKMKTNVVVSTLCPGPVDTEFNKKLGIDFSVKSMNSSYVAKYAIDKMLRGKKVIIPGWKMKLTKFVSKLLPDKIINNINYNIQKNKKK